VRTVLCVLAAGAVLFGGAAAGGAFSTAAVPPSAAYDHRLSAEIPVGDALAVNGQPMRLSLFYTSDAPAHVIAFYVRAFLERGLTPVTLAGHVSVFDPKDGLQRFVTAIEQRGGQTLVLVGSTDPSKPPQLLRSAEAAALPAPADARAFLGYRSDDEGARADSAQFVSASNSEDIREFYRRELSSKGFRERPDSSVAMLQFAKPGATFSVGIQELGEEVGAAVFVQRLEGDPTR
jgi:hypothetical protein